MARKKPDPMDIFVGQRVRLARQLEKVTQEQLGLALGLTFQQVQKYEKGTNRIAPSRLRVIAEKLNRPVSWFFDEQPNGRAKAEGSDVVTRMLSTSLGVQLAESYLAIKGNAGKHAVAQVAHALAHG